MREVGTAYPDDVVVTAIPCNAFGRQENGSPAEIKAFAEERFPGILVTERSEVNGAAAHPIMQLGLSKFPGKIGASPVASAAARVAARAACIRVRSVLRVCIRSVGTDSCFLFWSVSRVGWNFDGVFVFDKNGVPAARFGNEAGADEVKAAVAKLI